MCVICAGVAAAVAGTAIIVKGIKTTWPKPGPNYPPPPKSLYGEDLED
jgi:hypothetical protein